MRKYGLDNFEMEIIEITDNLLEREQYYIDLLKPHYNKNNPIVNLEEAKKKAREYSKKYAKIFLKNHPEYRKEYYAKKKGMTLEEFELYKENRHNSIITRAKTPETKSTETIEREEKGILYISVPERLKDKTIIIEINHGDSREHILVDSATKRFRI